MKRNPILSFNFVLKIYYPENVCVVNKSFEATTEFHARKLARNWQINCLAICGKDDQNREYLATTLRLV